MTKPAEKKIDYLTPFRKNREFKDNLKSDFTHLSDRERKSLIKANEEAMVNNATRVQG